MAYTQEQIVEIRERIYKLRINASKGELQLTVNGKTVRYASPSEMLDVADRLEQTVGGGAYRPTGLKSSRMVYRRG